VEEGPEEGNTEKQEEGGDVGAVEGLTDSPLVCTGMVTMVGSDEGKVVSGCRVVRGTAVGRWKTTSGWLLAMA
jgi:hypothetical protein